MLERLGARARIGERPLVQRRELLQERDPRRRLRFEVDRVLQRPDGAAHIAAGLPHVGGAGPRIRADGGGVPASPHLLQRRDGPARIARRQLRAGGIERQRRPRSEHRHRTHRERRAQRGESKGEELPGAHSASANRVQNTM